MILYGDVPTEPVQCKSQKFFGASSTSFKWLVMPHVALTAARFSLTEAALPHVKGLKIFVKAPRHDFYALLVR